jgi:ubiquinone/menaquinone biosynthesis C-methylase UbiE
MPKRDSAEQRRYGLVDQDPSEHSKHLSQMVEYYATTGSTYDAWHCNPNDHSSHNYALKEIHSVLRDTGSRTFLDICCGTGRAVRSVLDQGYIAVGIDASHELLQIANSQHGIPAAQLVKGDATQLPFPDEAFDVVCILGALHHTAMPHKLVSEAIRVSRKAIVISDEGNHFYGGMKQTLIRMGIFEPVYRAIFRRPPRTTRRMYVSLTDGPTYVFSMEEVIPSLRKHFADFRTLTFYTIAGRQFCSSRFPRIFARHVVVTAKGKHSKTN